MSGLVLGAIIGLVAYALFVGFVLAVDVAHSHHCKPGTGCAELKRGYGPCKRLKPRYPRRAKCAINRAAKHYGQSPAAMRATADCESDFRWWLNALHEGMFQFRWSTWKGTPYGRRSPYNPKWAALGAAWMWSVGRRGEWPNC